MATDRSPIHPGPTLPRPLMLSGFLLGFALGGFFDGILLHQILQWHHLLSGLEGGRLGDIRFQILADGLFHALMYVIAVAGLWLSWRARSAVTQPGSERFLLAWALLGFGLWHVIDGIVSHWILGIHRVRMDVDNPLVWDLLWIAVFGIAFIAAGWWLLRGGPGGGSGSGRRRGLVAPALAMTTLVAGPVAAIPPTDTTTVMVLFGSDTAATDVFAAVAAVDGRTIWSDASGELWAVALGPNGDVSPFYRHGALLVSRGWLAAGCLPWMRI